MNILTNSVSVAYGHAPSVLGSICISIGAQERIALIGPSGSGKSTMLKVLSMALAPSSGSLYVDGQDPWQQTTARLQRLRRSMHFCCQTMSMPARQRAALAVLSGLLPTRSVLFTVRTLLSPARVDIELAHSLLTRLGVQQCLWRQVESLSGGQQQRVVIARAMAADAQMLILDEPLSALDPINAESCLAMLVEHVIERGQALVCSLHQVELARQHLQRVVGLREGQIVFDCPASELGRDMITELYRGHEAEIQHGY